MEISSLVGLRIPPEPEREETAGEATLGVLMAEVEVTGWNEEPPGRLACHLLLPFDALVHREMIVTGHSTSECCSFIEMRRSEKSVHGGLAVENGCVDEVEKAEKERTSTDSYSWKLRDHLGAGNGTKECEYKVSEE